jgi:hypothetical protein
MVDVAPFIVSHDKFNLHYGAKINLVQLELARFVVPFRGVKNRVKTKTARQTYNLAVHVMLYPLLTTSEVCPIPVVLSNFILKPKVLGCSNCLAE